MSTIFEDFEVSCLTRHSSGTEIMWGLVNERLSSVLESTEQVGALDNWNTRRLLELYPVTMHDLFCLLYSQQIPEIILSCDRSKALAQVVDTRRFQELRIAAVGDPVLSAIMAISILEVLRGILLCTEEFEDIVPKFPCEDSDGEERLILDDTHITEPDELEVEEYSGKTRRLSEDRLQLGLMLQNDRLTDILKTFGRFRRVVTLLQDDEIPGHSEESTLDHGDILSNAEMSYLMTTPDEVIAADMASESLPVIRGIEHDGEGMGPMVMLLDVSSSMNYYRKVESGETITCIDWALGFCFAAAMQCKEDKRTMAVIPFNHCALEPIIFRDGVIDIPTLERLLGTTASGGTAFLEAANKANTLLEEVDGFEDADIVWITDGCVEGHEDNSETWTSCRKWAKEHEANGTRRYALDINDNPSWFINLSCGEAAQAFTFNNSESAVNNKSRVFSAVMDDDGEAATLSIFRDLRERSAGTDWL